jgi:alpha-tubulin suppressor-like RCC1 family protein
VPENLGDAIISISCGFRHTAALTSDGVVACRGRHDEGQCAVPPDLREAVTQNASVVCRGSNSYGQCDAPADLTDLIAVSCGRYHTTALKQDGNVAC